MKRTWYWMEDTMTQSWVKFEKEWWSIREQHPRWNQYGTQLQKKNGWENWKCGGNRRPCQASRTSQNISDTNRGRRRKGNGRRIGHQVRSAWPSHWAAHWGRWYCKFHFGIYGVFCFPNLDTSARTMQKCDMCVWLSMGRNFFLLLWSVARHLGLKAVDNDKKECASSTSPQFFWVECIWQMMGLSSEVWSASLSGKWALEWRDFFSFFEALMMFIVLTPKWYFAPQLP